MSESVPQCFYCHLCALGKWVALAFVDLIRIWKIEHWGVCQLSNDMKSSELRLFLGIIISIDCVLNIPFTSFD